MIRLLAICLMFAAGFNAAFADGRLTRIPVSRDFSKLAELAEARRIPILLMVSQDHCPFCELLKNEVLNPMVISGDYNDKVVMTELLIDVGDSVVDFKGNKVFPGKIAADYKTWVTPTILFLDHQGKEVQKRMLGVNTVEMYGFYLDESIDAALAAVKKGEPYAFSSSPENISDKVGHGGL